MILPRPSRFMRRAHAKREASERHDVEPDHLLQHRLVHVGRRTEGTEARVVDEDLRHDLPIREPARDLVDRTRRRQVEREQVGFGPQVAAQHFKSAHVAGDEKKPVAFWAASFASSRPMRSRRL